MPRPAERDLLVALGARLRDVRTGAGWTQEQLAAAVDVAPNTVSRFENGHLSLRISTLAHLARALGVSLGDLTDVAREVPVGRPPRPDAEMVRLYDLLDDDGRRLATNLVREVVDQQRWRTDKDG